VVVGSERLQTGSRQVATDTAGKRVSLLKDKPILTAKQLNACFEAKKNTCEEGGC